VDPATATPTAAIPVPLPSVPDARRRRQGGTSRYVIGRIGQSVLTLFGVLTIVFFAERLSGSPVRLLAGPNATPSDITNLTRQLGLDRPVSDQYLRFLSDAVRGNLGYSYVQGQSALHIVFSRIPHTAELAVAALLFSVVLGIPIGILSAFYRGRWPERVLMPIVLVGQSMPAFWSGILLILVFSVHFHLFPSSGAGGFKSLVLPMVTLGSLSLSTVARMARSSFIEHLGKDYVRTAAAKGASTLRVLLGHVFRNALLPILTITGLEAGNLLGGAVITETIFAWPGIGQLTVQSVESLDFPVVEAVVLVTSTVYITINLLVDLLYGVVDPRLRVQGSAA
jgi:peptide/nickel transport system permease protein